MGKDAPVFVEGFGTKEAKVRAWFDFCEAEGTTILDCRRFPISLDIFRQTENGKSVPSRNFIWTSAALKAWSDYYKGEEDAGDERAKG